MKVAELAREMGLSSQTVLDKLKSLKLKAKDDKQDLSSGVAAILRNELKSLVVAKSRVVPAVDPLRRPKWDRMEVKESPKESKAKVTIEPEEKSKKTSATQKATAQEKPAPKAQAAPGKPLAKSGAPPAASAPAVKDKAVVKSAPSAKPAAAAAPARPAHEPAKEKAKLSAPAAPVAAAPKPSTPVAAPVRAALPPQTPVKPKPLITISDEPFVSVKPLAKKKRMIPGGRDHRDHHAGPKSAAAGEKSVAAPAPWEAEAADRPLQDIEIKLPISVKDLAVKFQQKPSAILTVLMKMGAMANINQYLDEEVVKRLAQQFGFNLLKVKTQEEQLVELHDIAKDDPTLLRSRPPVVTFMGHVDHGKTSLLDRIRKSQVADSEHGGITQHIGAYSVKIAKGRITFLDTPGHEAFTAMRARGAHITDIVVLVVAADEGIMPQTEEAIDHARAAKVPIVVAINKIDKKNANLDRVKKQLQDRDLAPEDWGGKTICMGVSATTGEGVDQLLEMILLEAELLELKANFEKRASGIVVEAHMSQGKGAMATLIVQNGILKEGNILVCGPYYGKIKALFDDYERPIEAAGPSTPVEILGLPSVPDAGELFYVVEDERRAREIAYKRREQIQEQKLQRTSKITLEDLYSKIQQGTIKELNVIIKGDVQGSVEALIDSLKKIPSDQVQLNMIHIGVGDINASDVILASASEAIILGFHVEIDVRAKEELEKTPVDVRSYRIIYDAVNDVRNALEGLLEPKTRKKFIARVEIRNVFKLSKSGIVAGCYVQKGKVIRKSNVDLVRNGETIFSGTIASLKRFKDDVKEVSEEMECGISLNNYTAYEVGDILEVYEVEKIARKL